jgi:hypothetical protein
MHKNKRHILRPALANKIGSTRRLQAGEQARVLIIILALVSFLLGVAATAFWFHLASNRHADDLSSQTNSEPSVGQSAGQPSEQPINGTVPVQPFVASHPPVDAATIEAVKQAIPDYASVPLADGTQILRAAALKQFAAAATEMDAQVKQAQEQLVQAENGQSTAGQSAALKHLQQIQADQTEKLQQIAAQLQAQIAALKQLKNAK